MKYEMKHAVFEKMFQATEGQIPMGAEALTAAAHQNNQVATVLPFYMYCFHPREWQEYTLFTTDPLPSTLNYATYIALDAPALHADPPIKRFFYGVVSIVPIPDNHQTSRSIEDWTYHLFRQYSQIHQQTIFLEHRVNVRSHHPKDWLIKTSK
ncbi:hypothetical protein [Marinococcus sp. PL1-022]|uniref:hypothetical protein n=1 Tax=Marinococcus sp. PL1-022 TaxID=3095363 RepID=UPI0029C32BB0|nr:hypothetical protein [Marinococcus sp. PL1-022]MDX6153107.1 hypothetical protein [Marinococcus sp. PL1-022]